MHNEVLFSGFGGFVQFIVRDEKEMKGGEIFIFVRVSLSIAQKNITSENRVYPLDKQEGSGFSSSSF